MKVNPILYSLCYTGLLLFIIHNLQAQESSSARVPNDNAADAITLGVDSGDYRSNTTNCTLEEKCIDRQLTAKCLVYHNDQWFTFHTTNAPVYYLMIKNQQCRDIKGVQLLIIDGCVCKPSTYSILNCISLATQDNISLTLDNLLPDHSYIINLDGYLNDFCEFDISISTVAPDFHLYPVQNISVHAQPQKDGVYFEWQLNEELIDEEVTEFEILRRFETENKFHPVKTVEVQRNVNGNYSMDYVYMDSLYKSGMYQYKVIAVSPHKGKRFLLSEHTFKLYIDRSKITLTQVPIKLDIKDKTEIRIDMYRYPDNDYIGNYKAVYHDNFQFDIKPYLKNGNNIKQIKLVITSPGKEKYKQEIILDIQ